MGTYRIGGFAADCADCGGPGRFGESFCRGAGACVRSEQGARDFSLERRREDLAAGAFQGRKYRRDRFVYETEQFADSLCGIAANAPAAVEYLSTVEGAGDWPISFERWRRPLGAADGARFAIGRAGANGDCICAEQS